LGLFAQLDHELRATGHHIANFLSLLLKGAAALAADKMGYY